MKSRTSFFNPTALRKDITRFAPVWAIYLIGGLLVGLTTLSSGNYYAQGYASNELASTTGTLAVINMVYAIINAELLFGDLFNNRLCNALHAFPLRRESWFATHTIAGLLFSLVPNLILSICFLPFMGEMWYISFIWLLAVTLEYLFFFGLGAFSAICTGNRFAMAAVYAIINFASMIAYWFVDTFYAPLLYGLHIRETGFVRLCPSVWMTEVRLFKFQYLPVNDNYSDGYRSMEFIYDGLTEHWWYLAILAVLGVALLAAAVLLYRRRKLESAGDFVAFSWLKPIFSVVFTLSMGALFEMFGDLFVGIDYVFLAVGIIVGYFVSQMLLQRTVRVFRKKAFAACAAIGSALVVSIALTALDPIGITRWTPKPEKVESIILSSSYYYEPDQTRNVQTITSPGLIEDLVQIHEQILEEGEWDRRNASGAIHLTYQMSDGRQIERRYRYNAYGEAAEKLNNFFSAPEFILGYQDWQEFLDSVDQVSVENNIWPRGDKAYELLEAIKADCEAGTMVQDRDYEVAPYWVDIKKEDTFIGLNVYYDCENTIKWIKENLKFPQ